MRASLVLIPQIETDVVGMKHWLSQAFADGVVMGQIPLGPVLIVATSMGCKVERRVAAAVATAAQSTSAEAQAATTKVFKFAGIESLLVFCEQAARDKSGIR